MNKLEIRKMEERDIPGLAKLYEQFWGEISFPEKMKKLFKKLENNPNYIFLNATLDNKVVGSIMGIICEELYGDCNSFMIVEDFIVDKSSHRKGIGSVLFKELESIAKNKNCSQIMLITESDRTDACNFYYSVGFRKDTHKGFKKKLK